MEPAQAQSRTAADRDAKTKELQCESDRPDKLGRSSAAPIHGLGLAACEFVLEFWRDGVARRNVWRIGICGSL